ncbi:MAG: hypothetical protein MI743_06785 [Sneathiellales bacterium]|nr:hypothetical protein [Sneathiellales bacterium]
MGQLSEFRGSSVWFRCLLTGLLGLVLFSLAMIFWPVGIHLLFDWIAFEGSPPPPLMEPAAREYLGFVYGVMGAIMLGWSGTLLYIAKGPLRDGKNWAWNAIALPLTLWFIADSLHSILTGFWQNAVFNLAFYILLGLPLLLLKKGAGQS